MRRAAFLASSAALVVVLGACGGADDVGSEIASGSSPMTPLPSSTATTTSAADSDPNAPGDSFDDVASIEFTLRPGATGWVFEGTLQNNDPELSLSDGALWAIQRQSDDGKTWQTIGLVPTYGTRSDPQTICDPSIPDECSETADEPLTLETGDRGRTRYASIDSLLPGLYRAGVYVWGETDDATYQAVQSELVQVP